MHKGGWLKHPCWWMVVAALAVRLIVMSFLYSDQLDPRLNSWSFGYEEGRIARSLAVGKGFSNPLFTDTGPTAWLAPAYPFLLAAFFKTFGVYTKASAIAILSFQSLITALTCIPIYFYARRRFGERTALISGWVWAFFPYSVYYPIERIWDTWLVTLIVSLLFLLALHLEESESVWMWAGFGSLAGLLALTSPGGLLMVPPLALWSCYRLHQQRRRWHRGLGAATLVAVLVVSPWIVRNYQTFHEVIPIRDCLGLEFRIGNNGDSSHIYTKSVGPWDIGKGPEWVKFQRMGEIEYFHHEGKQAFAYIYSHPAWYAGMILRRVMNVWTEFWSFSPQYLAEETFDLIIVPLCALLSVLTMLGLAAAFRQSFTAAMPYAIVLLFYPIPYYLTHTETYYRRPIDPMMVVLASYAVANWYSRRIDLAASPAEIEPEAEVCLTT